MKKYFYCYSYQLMNFLKLQNEHYIKIGKHSNGNKYWVFLPSERLNNNLTKWNLYKKAFPQKEKSND